MGEPEKSKEVKKSSIKESVQSMIDKSDAKRQAEVAASASEKAADTQGEVADVMAGVEKPSEKVSERKGESGEKGDIKATVASDDDAAAAAVSVNLKDYTFPSEEVMVKKIRTAINVQIKQEWKNAKKFKGRIAIGGAADYNQAISRIRQLKEALQSLFGSTVDFMKQMYVKYFTPDGNRRQL